DIKCGTRSYDRPTDVILLKCPHIQERCHSTTGNLPLNGRGNITGSTAGWEDTIAVLQESGAEDILKVVILECLKRQRPNLRAIHEGLEKARRPYSSTQTCHKNL